MSTSSIIRKATKDDTATIAEYNQALARETEGRELDPARIVPGVLAVLSDSSKGSYFVAENSGSVVGQLMVTYEWSDWRNGMFWWIQSVYVQPLFRRQGVFRALYRHVETLAKNAEQVCGLRLYMDHHNTPARRTYLKLGLQPAGYEVLERDFVLR